MIDAGPTGSPPPRRRVRRRRHARPPMIKKPEVKNEINVTPLVDVVLVLLIIFMVVTPMLSRGVAVDLPVTEHHDKKNDTGQQVVVSITKDGRIFLDADPVGVEEIGTRLRRELDGKAKGGGGREIHVKGDRALAYGEVRKVLERIHEAGAGHVALGTEELKHKKE